MVVFVFGGSKSGKSNFAQNLSVQIAQKKNLYYVAAMIPHDAEDEIRIKKHRAARAGLGFKTVECAYDLNKIFEDKKIKGEGTFLVESLTALLSNAMFKNHQADFDAWKKINAMLLSFMEKCKNCVFVCDSVFSDAERYGRETEAFRLALGKIASFASALSDEVVEVKNGCATVIGGDGILKNECGLKKYFFITGGAYNGKLEYAKKRFGLSADDIALCEQNREPDFSKRCIAYLENYIWFCIHNNIEPRTDWKKDTVFICTDIFCGVVPMDKDVRAWREKAGEYFQRLAKESVCTRVSFGLAQDMGE